MTTVMYTGGTGRMGSVIRERLAGRYPRTVLYARSQPESSLFPGEEVVVGDLADLDALTAAARGVDVVVHLGGLADEAPFSDILETNIAGTYHVYEAARRAGVRRVVYGSSNHVTGFHDVSEVLTESSLLRPDTYYGVSKAFGEALAALYHDKWGVESVLLRIGAFRPEPEDVRQLSIWLSWDDGAELVRCAVDAPAVGCQVVYGCSANSDSWWDGTAGWAAIGYAPRDDAAGHADRVDRTRGEPTLQGGGFTAADYRGGIW
ncbi:uronate dehydrogenase [Streptomyces sp. Amel2xB2]|uniref:NAD-dependent epimerase/dehydratase family protein n=1 Tax=Streptomyces sp. Amel2xB2 TaxID=1305829 RepID=UPI000DB9219E|nr:NAD(P)-dependent oxidoreductase [Streptomyces sp. Amel2xB2]RAJ71242.1 uronate dehydrogenase [Streptomyces sp. Amel2xB2]